MIIDNAFQFWKTLKREPEEAPDIFWIGQNVQVKKRTNQIFSDFSIVRHMDIGLF